MDIVDETLKQVKSINLKMNSKNVEEKIKNVLDEFNFDITLGSTKYNILSSSLGKKRSRN